MEELSGKQRMQLDELIWDCHVEMVFLELSMKVRLVDICLLVDVVVLNKVGDEGAKQRELERCQKGFLGFELLAESIAHGNHVDLPVNDGSLGVVLVGKDELGVALCGRLPRSMYLLRRESI